MRGGPLLALALAGCTVTATPPVPPPPTPSRIIVVPAAPQRIEHGEPTLSRQERRDLLDDAHESLDRATRMLDWLNGVNDYQKHPAHKPVPPSPDAHP